MQIPWVFVGGCVALYVLVCVAEAAYNSWVDRSIKSFPRNLWESFKTPKDRWKKKK